MTVASSPAVIPSPSARFLVSPWARYFAPLAGAPGFHLPRGPFLVPEKHPMSRHHYGYGLLTLHIRLPERHSGFSSLILNFSRRGLGTTALCFGGPHFKLPEGNSVLRDNQQLCFSSSGCTSFSTGRMEIPENSTNSLYWKLPLRWMMAIVCSPFQTLLSFPVLLV